MLVKFLIFVSLALSLSNCQYEEDESDESEVYREFPKISLKGLSKEEIEAQLESEAIANFTNLVTSVQNYVEEFDREPFADRDETYFLLLKLEFQLEASLVQYRKHGKIEAIENLLSVVRTELKKPQPDRAEVEHLEWRVGFHLDIPIWWRFTTLCFRYYSDVKDKYCSGKTPSCAPVGHYTELFHDWSRNAGGCHVSWGLFSDPEADGWFKELELCLEHKSHCGKKVKEEICAPVNSYTDYYHDQTGSKGDKGCFVDMSWRIKTPNAKLMPAWLMNSKVCLRSRTFQNYWGKHDSGLVTTCSMIDEPTKVYEDRTYFNTYVDYREAYWQLAIMDSLDRESEEHLK